MNDKEMEKIFNFVLNNMGNSELMRLVHLQETAQIYYLKSEKLQAENKKLREALVECPIVGEIHSDSNERFKEWNLIHRNTIREALKEVGEE